ncbi:MAG: hypothetical protein M3N98_11185 [Actinomycetota bacterium]|nr:hypothetical protein [Actinomycetota bacterium]
MAELEVVEGELVLHLSVVEKAEAVHGDLHVPLSSVRGVEVIDDAHDMTRIKTGFKVGMRIPGAASVAVVRRSGHKMFVAVHRDTPRGVRVRLEGGSYNEWIVGATDPESVVSDLTRNLEN